MEFLKILGSDALIRQFFTENELDLVSLKKKKRVNWTATEVGKALGLRILSRRAYVFVREVMHYPLPGVSTLKRWAAKLNMRSGILEDVINVMHFKSRSFDMFEKLTVLSFDEMKVRECIEYDQLLDEVIGPKKKVQVVMARGLTGKWKQPVFVDFDQKMTKEILLNILEKLHLIGLLVVCCTSDCASENQTLYSSLGATYEKPYFKHPCNDFDIVCMHDLPHVLKLIRNWLLDKGLILNDCLVINRKPFQTLIDAAQTEVNACYKLQDRHLTRRKSERQNVRLAAELLSHTVATAIAHYNVCGDAEKSEKVASFIELINNFFDLFNVRTWNQSTPYKSPYGCDLYLQKQNELVKETKEVFFNLRSVGKPGLQIFQKVIIRATEALPKLYETVNTLCKELVSTKF
ncbi:hypothetical protein V9T40_003324 [Parthenolecanium corni]|uniref:Transposable element P transposase n=1 Tax=Parthenolecanium corni TaxID=536013 RepID=A0AAN9TV38_9HEMI